MKRLIIAGLALAAFASFAGTCSVINVRVTSYNSHKTLGGELQNTSGANLLQHNIRVTFFDSNNNIVESKITTGCLRSLQNNASDFFSVTTTDNGNSSVSAISALAYDSTLRAGTTVTGNASISNVQIHRNGLTLTVTGTLTNNDGTTLTSPVVCAVVRDDSDGILVVGKDTTSDLAQNVNDSFSITLPVPSDSSIVNTVDFWFDGLEGGVPIAPESSTGHQVTVCASTATATNSSTTTATDTATATDTTTPVSTSTVAPTATTDPCS
jgi:hypothetical protein